MLQIYQFSSYLPSRAYFFYNILSCSYRDRVTQTFCQQNRIVSIVSIVHSQLYASNDTSAKQTFHHLMLSFSPVSYTVSFFLLNLIFLIPMEENYICLLILSSTITQHCRRKFLFNLHKLSQFNHIYIVVSQVSCTVTTSSIIQINPSYHLLSIYRLITFLMILTSLFLLSSTTNLTSTFLPSDLAIPSINCLLQSTYSHLTIILCNILYYLIRISIHPTMFSTKSPTYQSICFQISSFINNDSFLLLLVDLRIIALITYYVTYQSDLLSQCHEDIVFYCCYKPTYIYIVHCLSIYCRLYKLVCLFQRNLAVLLVVYDLLIFDINLWQFVCHPTHILQLLPPLTKLFCQLLNQMISTALPSELGSFTLFELSFDHFTDHPEGTESFINLLSYHLCRLLAVPSSKEFSQAIQSISTPLIHVGIVPDVPLAQHLFGPACDFYPSILPPESSETVLNYIRDQPFSPQDVAAAFKAINVKAAVYSSNLDSVELICTSFTENDSLFHPGDLHFLLEENVHHIILFEDHFCSLPIRVTTYQFTQAYLSLDQQLLDTVPPNTSSTEVLEHLRSFFPVSSDTGTSSQLQSMVSPTPSFREALLHAPNSRSLNRLPNSLSFLSSDTFPEIESFSGDSLLITGIQTKCPELHPTMQRAIALSLQDLSLPFSGIIAIHFTDDSRFRRTSEYYASLLLPLHEIIQFSDHRSPGTTYQHQCISLPPSPLVDLMSSWVGPVPHIRNTLVISYVSPAELHLQRSGIPIADFRNLAFNCPSTLTHQIAAIRRALQLCHLPFTVRLHPIAVSTNGPNHRRIHNQEVVCTILVDSKDLKKWHSFLKSSSPNTRSVNLYGFTFMLGPYQPSPPVLPHFIPPNTPTSVISQIPSLVTIVNILDCVGQLRKEIQYLFFFYQDPPCTLSADAVHVSSTSHPKDKYLVVIWKTQPYDITHLILCAPNASMSTESLPGFPDAFLSSSSTSSRPNLSITSRRRGLTPTSPSTLSTPIPSSRTPTNPSLVGNLTSRNHSPHLSSVDSSWTTIPSRPKHLLSSPNHSSMLPTTPTVLHDSLKHSSALTLFAQRRRKDHQHSTTINDLMDFGHTDDPTNLSAMDVDSNGTSLSQVSTSPTVPTSNTTFPTTVASETSSFHRRMAPTSDLPPANGHYSLSSFNSLQSQVTSILDFVNNQQSTNDSIISQLDSLRQSQDNLLQLITRLTQQPAHSIPNFTSSSKPTND